jgi:cytochrome c oxidase assembly protein subunit 11
MDEMDETRPDHQLARQHRKVGLWCAAVVVGMVCASYAAVPLYRMLCELTSFDGTPQRATAPSDVVLDRSVNIRFGRQHRTRLPWQFEPRATPWT